MDVLVLFVYNVIENGIRYGCVILQFIDWKDIELNLEWRCREPSICSEFKHHPHLSP